MKAVDGCKFDEIDALVLSEVYRQDIDTTMS